MTLVVGATGLVGSAICRRLRARGTRVRAFVRADSPGAPRLHEIGCDLAVGDLTDEASVTAACHRVAVVVATANTAMRRRSSDRIDAVDRLGLLRLVDQARRAGAARFVFTSVSPNLPVDNTFIQAKREVEAAVEASGMSWIVLQPAAFMEIHTGPVGGWDFARGRARMVGQGRAPASYISAHDVAAFGVAAATASPGTNVRWRLAGPEPLSPIDAIRIAERVTGRPFKVQRMPAAVLRAVSSAIRPFNPTLGALLRMVAAGEHGDTANTAPLAGELGIRQITFEQYVRAAIGGGLPEGAL